MITALHTPKLQLSNHKTPDGRTLHFAFRGETIDDMLKDYSLEEILGLLDSWQATNEAGEVLIVHAGPYITREEIRAILPDCTLEKVGEV